jgi:hypothetical protein
MKQMTCAQMGGPATCTTILSGNTPEEMVADGMKHVTEVHPEMLKDITAMSKEDTDKWMEGLHEKFDAMSEMPAPAAPTDAEPMA